MTKIPNYYERESMKSHGDHELSTQARYYRFIGDLIGGSGLEIEDSDVPLTLEEYKSLMMIVPEWSYGPIRPGSKRSKIGSTVGHDKINSLYDWAAQNRKRLLDKYPKLKEQEGDLTI